MFLFLGTLLYGQDRDSYMGFGKLPHDVPTYFYNNLKTAETQEERLAYLDTIALIHLRHDAADSLWFYGVTMRSILSVTDAYSPYHFKSYYYTGLGRQKQGLLDSAIEQFLEGIAEPRSSTFDKKLLAYGLAQTYLLKKTKSDKTREILDTIAVGTENPKLASQIALLEGDYAYTKGAFAKARIHYTNSRKLLDRTSNPKQELQIAYVLAKVSLQEGDVDGALNHFKDIKTSALSNGFYDLYINAILYEGRIYTSKENYDVAAIALNTAYANTLQWNRMILQQRVLKELTRLYSITKDYKNAYALSTQLSALTSSIASAQNERLVRDLEIRYETLEKEKEITSLQTSQLEKQNEIQRQKTIKNAFLIGFLIVLIPIISFLVVYYQKLQTQSKLNAQQEKMKEQEVHALMQEQSLELARATVAVQHEERHRIARELHDSIGGNLGAIKLQLTANEDQKNSFLLKQIDQTYEQVREISHSLIPKEFGEELFTNLIHQFIEGISKANPFSIEFIPFPEKEINALSQKMQVSLFNCIKELLTNAVKHAAATAIALQLSYLKEEDSLQLLYEDNGKGFIASKAKKGIGLKNIASRIQEVSGTMTIDSTLGRGTVISLQINNVSENDKEKNYPSR